MMISLIQLHQVMKLNELIKDFFSANSVKYASSRQYGELVGHISLGVLTDRAAWALLGPSPL